MFNKNKEQLNRIETYLIELVAASRGLTAMVDAGNPIDVIWNDKPKKKGRRDMWPFSRFVTMKTHTHNGQYVANELNDFRQIILDLQRQLDELTKNVNFLSAEILTCQRKPVKIQKYDGGPKHKPIKKDPVTETDSAHLSHWGPVSTTHVPIIPVAKKKRTKKAK